MPAMNRWRGVHHVAALANNPAENLASIWARSAFSSGRSIWMTPAPSTSVTVRRRGGRARSSLSSPLLVFVPAATGRDRRVEIGFAMPRAALGYRLGRLTERRIDFEGPFDRFGERVVRFKDPDGLQLELVTDEKAVRREG